MPCKPKLVIEVVRPHRCAAIAAVILTSMMISITVSDDSDGHAETDDDGHDGGRGWLWQQKQQLQDWCSRKNNTWLL